MTSVLQHYLNPLHIYCRMRDLGISKKVALCMCRLYECIFFNQLFAKESD